MKTRAQQREDTRERIIVAAAKSFSELGFRGASTREIAHRAGANQGLITYHFQTKEALWRAAADHIFGHMRSVMAEAMASVEATEPRERARSLLRAFVRYAAAHPEQFRLLVEEGKHADDRMQWLVDTHMKPMYESFCDIGTSFGTGLDAAMLPHAFYALAGAASVIFAVVPECVRLTGLDPRTEQAIETHAEFVARLLVP